MRSNTSINRELDTRVVIIREVNMAAQKIVVEDSASGQFQVSFHLLDPLVTIPKVGEGWLVRRLGVDWLLDRRLETGQEQTPITALSQGDSRLEANIIYLNGVVKLNGRTVIPSELVYTSPISLSQIPHGTEGQVLTTISGVPSWATPSGTTSVGVLNLGPGSTQAGAGDGSSWPGKSTGARLSVQNDGTLKWETVSVFNIVDFGAIGDGNDANAIHNSACIQNAVDACLLTSTTGGIVYIPPGVFSIYYPIIPRNAVTFLGSGWNSSIKIAANRNIDAFDSGPNSGLTNGRFERFSVNCNGPNNSGHGLGNYTGTGFVGSYSFCVWDSMEIANGHFRGLDLAWPFRGDGWPVSSGFQNAVRDCSMATDYECIYSHYPVTDSHWGPGNSLSAGIYASANIVIEGGPHQIFKNHLHGTPIHNVYSEGASIVTFEGNIMEQAQQENIHLKVTMGGGSQGWTWKFVGNTLESNAINITPGPSFGQPIPNTYDAIFIESQDTTSTIGPILISNNVIRTIYARYVVNLTKAKHIQILGNTMTQSDTNAYMQSVPFNLTNGCSDIMIADNTPSNQFSGDITVVNVFDAWHNMSYVNSWVDYDATTWAAGQYRILSNGWVQLRGVIKSGAVNTVICTLPAGYRPAKNEIFEVNVNGGEGTVYVLSTGDVKLAELKNGGNTVNVSLSGIEFAAVA